MFRGVPQDSAGVQTFTLFGDSSPFSDLLLTRGQVIQAKEEEKKTASYDFPRLLYDKQRLLIELRSIQPARKAPTRVAETPTQAVISEAPSQQPVCRPPTQQQQQAASKPPSVRKRNKKKTTQRSCKRDWGAFFSSLIAIVVIGFLCFSHPFRGAEARFAACVRLHNSLLFDQALAECRAAEKVIKTARVRNRLGLVLYDSGHLEEAEYYQALAAESDPNSYEVTLAVVKEARLVTNLLVKRLLPIGYDLGFLHTDTSTGKLQLVFRSKNTGDSPFRLERRLTPAAIEICDKFRPCIKALKAQMATAVKGNMPAPLPPLDGTKEKHVLESEVAYILDIFRRHGPRTHLTTPTGVFDLSKDMLPRFLAVFDEHRRSIHKI